MYRIRSLKAFLAIVSGLIITLFGVFSINRIGVAEMIFGTEFANSHIYPILGMILEGLAFISIFVIIGLIIMAVISYIRNHGKPDKPSEEVKAITKLENKLDELIKRIDKRWPK